MTLVKLIKFLDKHIGSFLCLILSFFSANPKMSKYSNILIIQLWGIGETISALPAISMLRKKYKSIKIDALITNRIKDVFYNNKSIDNARILNLNPISIKLFIFKNFKKYDLVVDMEEYLNISSITAFFVGKERIGYSHGIRSKLYTKKVEYNDKQHVSQTFADLLKPLGIKKRIKNLEKLSYSNKDKKTVEKLLKKHKISKKDFLIGFGFGAAESVKERMWPMERFAQLADFLIKKYKAKIILIGNKDEENLGNEIIKLVDSKKCVFNFAGKTSVGEMFYLISLCRLFIGNDAGPMHVAAAQGVKTIGLFGCNLPVRFAPFGKNNIAIRQQAGKACINVHKGEAGTCRYGKENACVKRIKVGDVVKEISKIKKSRLHITASLTR